MRLSSFLLGWFVLFAVALPSTARAQAVDEPEGEASADSVALTFAWPEGLEARVTMERFRERITPEGGDTLTATATYRMSTERQDQNLLVQHEGFNSSVSLGVGDGGAEEELVHRLAAIMPDFVVSHSGAFEGLGDPASLEEAVDATVVSIYPDTAAVGAELRTAVSRVIAPAVLSASASELWDFLVGFWNGSTLDVGAAYELEVDAPMPILPEQDITMLLSYSVAERAPCSEKEEEARCVRLEIVSAPDSAALSAFVRDHGSQIAGEDARLAFEEIGVERSVSVIAEPATLIPHLLVVTRAFEGVAREEGAPEEEGWTFEEVDQRVYTFEY